MGRSPYVIELTTEHDNPKKYVVLKSKLSLRLDDVLFIYLFLHRGLDHFGLSRPP